MTTTCTRIGQRVCGSSVNCNLCRYVWVKRSPPREGQIGYSAMCSPTKCSGSSLLAAHTATAIEHPCCSDSGSDLRVVLETKPPIIGSGCVDEVKELGRCEGTRLLHTCLVKLMRSDYADCKRHTQK